MEKRKWTTMKLIEIEVELADMRKTGRTQQEIDTPFLAGLRFLFENQF